MASVIWEEVPVNQLQAGDVSSLGPVDTVIAVGPKMTRIVLADGSRVISANEMSVGRQVPPERVAQESQPAQK